MNVDEGSIAKIDVSGFEPNRNPSKGSFVFDFKINNLFVSHGLSLLTSRQLV